MKNVFGIFFGIALVVAVAYGSWRLERWFHYKFSYQSQVRAELVPLRKQIADLERRVSVLETNPSYNTNHTHQAGRP